MRMEQPKNSNKTPILHGLRCWWEGKESWGPSGSSGRAPAWQMWGPELSKAPLEDSVADSYKVKQVPSNLGFILEKFAHKDVSEYSSITFITTQDCKNQNIPQQVNK
jgi:hypothetical protein